MGNRGFSLIELLMVVGIAALLAGMAGYSMRYAGANHFSIQKATMMETLTQARNLAAMRSECVQVTITPAGVLQTASFLADAGRTCAGVLTPSKTLPDVDFGAENVIIGALSNGTNRIMFNPKGGLIPDQMITFTMTDRNGERANVRILPAIGQIRVQ